MSLPLTTLSQVRRLASHIEDAHRTSPYYRALYGDRCPSVLSVDALRDLPYITKDDVLADQQGDPPYGTLLAVPLSSVARVYCTAGTTYMLLSGKDIRTAATTQARMWKTVGVRPGDLVDISMTYHWVLGGTLFDEGLRRAGAAVVPGGPGQSEMRVEMMRRTGVTVLQAFTTYAEALVEVALEQGIDPAADLQVRLVLIGGELRSSESKRELEKAWGGAAVRELYGTSEAGIAAIECGAVGDGMHVSPDVVVEIIDPDTGEAADPRTGGEIVLTELTREAQPFIRHRTGDITEGVDLEPCPCGKRTPRLRRILGRRSGIARVKGIFLHPGAVNDVLGAIAGIARHAVRIDRPAGQDRITVLVEPSGQDGDLLDRVKERITAQFGVSCEVEVVQRGALRGREGALEDERNVT